MHKCCPAKSHWWRLQGGLLGLHLGTGRASASSSAIVAEAHLHQRPSHFLSLLSEPDNLHILGSSRSFSGKKHIRATCVAHGFYGKHCVIYLLAYPSHQIKVRCLAFDSGAKLLLDALPFMAKWLRLSKGKDPITPCQCQNVEATFIKLHCQLSWTLQCSVNLPEGLATQNCHLAIPILCIFVFKCDKWVQIQLHFWQSFLEYFRWDRTAQWEQNQWETHPQLNIHPIRWESVAACFIKARHILPERFLVFNQIVLGAWSMNMILPNPERILAEFGDPRDWRQSQTHLLKRFEFCLQHHYFLQILLGRYNHRESRIFPTCGERFQAVSAHPNIFEIAMDLWLIAKKSHLEITKAGFNNGLAKRFHGWSQSLLRFEIELVSTESRHQSFHLFNGCKLIAWLNLPNGRMRKSNYKPQGFLMVSR